MITIERLRYAYPRQTAPAVDDLSGVIEAGSYLLVCGPSGSGKSTLVRTINGLVPHFHGGRFGGQVLVQGIDTRQETTANLSLRAGFVAQDPETQIVMDRVEDEIAFGLENRGLPRDQLALRVEEAFDLLGIAHLRSREATTLLGGERQRVVLAAAMATRPEILVLDEPTSQLDPWGAEEILTAIERLNTELGITIVLVEHRLDRVLQDAEQVWILEHGGTLAFDGPVQASLAHLPEPPALVRIGQVLGWDPVPLTVRDARRRAVQDLSPRRPAPAIVPVSHTTPTVEIERVSYAYDDRAVLQDVTVAFGAGTVTAIIGRNGSGKTTLLKQINGLLRPQSGQVRVLGQRTDQRDTASLARTVAYLPQNPGAMLFNETVDAELRFTLACQGKPGDPDAVMRRFGIGHLADRHPFDLSGGERQRAALAAILVADPKIVLLDEPTRGMDAGRKRELGQILRGLVEEGRTVILVTHDVELIAAAADRVVVLAEGRIIADGPPRGILPGSLTYATATNRVFGDTYLLPEDVINYARRDAES